MNHQALSTSLTTLLARTVGDAHPAREDSRAFGAMLEQQVADAWPALCAELNATPVPKPGRRSVYDLALHIDGVLVGMDIKTKDLDAKTYSDGGVCSVDNLIQFLVRDAGILMVAEIAHRSDGQGGRSVVAVSVVPIHLLPETEFRIENLGTGQLRLNRPVHETLTDIAWSRTLPEFLELFTELAIRHFNKVGEVALARAKAMEAFRAGGFAKLRLPS